MARRGTRTSSNPRGIPTDGYKSKLEAAVAKNLKSRGVAFEYESRTFDYSEPRSYTPDLLLEGPTTKHGTRGREIHIEIKGWFRSEDRTKAKLVRDQNPGIDIRFVFQRAASKLSKRSQTTYAQWCDKNNFKWAESTVPQEWIDELTN